MRLLDAHLDLDVRCNYRCIYCQNTGAPADGPPYFPVDALRAVLPLLSRSCWSVFLSCGGEPLLHPKFEEAISVVNETLRGTDVVIVTNGLALTAQKAAAILQSCISRVQISVHTVDPAVYAHLYRCRESDFFSVKSNVESLVRNRKKKWPKILLTAIAMKSTIASLPKVAKWGADAGIDGMRVQWLEPFDTEGMDEEVIARGAEAIAALTETQRILNERGVFLEWPSSFGLKKIISAVQGAAVIRNKFDYGIATAGKFLASRKKNNCHLAGYSFRVTNRGDLRFCHRDAVRLPNLLENPTLNLKKVFKNAVDHLDCGANRQCIDCPFRH